MMGMTAMGQAFPRLMVLAFFVTGTGSSWAGEAKKPVAVSPEAARFFETKVRPVLVEHCHKCHGEKKPKAHLRLDTLAGMLIGNDNGPAIVAGHPEKSALIKAISYTDPEVKMPPDKKLSREQIDDLTRWIKMGAPWPGQDPSKIIIPPRKGEFAITDKDRAHWAFQPIKRPAVPKLKNPAWVANPIDAFILAKLEAKGLAPNPQASKQELMRRLYYDLTGLPPTPKEVEDFVSDTAQDVYEKLVDRLLASPHYGEKYARYWLDLVRYAETNSYERDNPKPHVWRYRDYVIRAFNDDKPYDRFLHEQLAGDEIAPGDADALVATGYYRLGVWDDEPSDPLLARYDALDDILATTSHTMLGLTVDCARCHNHKIDPIPQKDYYRLLAFFHNINHFRNGGPTDEIPILTPEKRKAFEEAAKKLDQRRNEVQDAINVIEKEFRALYEKKGNKGLQAGDMDDLRYKFYRNSWMKLPDFAAVKHEDEGKLPGNLFDIAPRTRNEAIGFVFEGTLIVPRDGKHTFYLDSDDGSRLTVNGKMVLEYDGIHGMGMEKKATVDLPKGRLPIKLEYFQNLFGYGLSVAWEGPEFKRRSLSATERAPIADGGAAALLGKIGPSVIGQEKYETYKKLRKELDGLKKQKAPAEMALGVTEAGSRAGDTHLLIRGNPPAKGEKVTPGFLTVLNLPDPNLPEPGPGAKSTGRRTVLAQWLTAKENPLTARVMANRIWQYHFGRGIVRTPSDFGVQGMRPTHPELLDWLASEFVANGWSMKKLHKLILTSNAYKMSSRGNDKGLAVDAANDLFWRFDMRRLSAEEIRDSILAVSGNLNLKMGGPPIYPEIPKEVLAGQSVPGRGWPTSSPVEQARRSIYVHVKRSLLLPILESFDLAEPDRTTPLRFATTQPTQALLMLNSDFLHKQAVVLAERLKKEAGKETSDQVRLALALATQRRPRDEEVRRGVNLIADLQKTDGLSPDAALRFFCLLALNLNEMVYVD